MLVSHPRCASTLRMATWMAAMLPCPPNSATKRPPGFSARWTPASIASWSRTQCSAAFENTASNSRSNGNRSASITRASSPRAVRRGNHLLGRIDAHNRRARRGDFLGERALAAADIENPLPRLGIQQLEDGRAERRHIGRIGPVGVARPAVHRAVQLYPLARAELRYASATLPEVLHARLPAAHSSRHADGRQSRRRRRDISRVGAARARRFTCSATSTTASGTTRACSRATRRDTGGDSFPARAIASATCSTSSATAARAQSAIRTARELQTPFPSECIIRSCRLPLA